MSFGPNCDLDNGINEINMTPLVDVMLVLLVIFIVTLPAIKQSIVLDLPDVTATPLSQEAQPIKISVDKQGQYHWDENLITLENLEEKFSQLGHQRKMSSSDSTPSVQIYADQDVKYSKVAQLMSLAQINGITKIGFIVDGENKQVAQK